MRAPEADDVRFAAVQDARPDDEPWPQLNWPPGPETRLLGRVVEVVPVVPERDGEELFEALDDDRVWQSPVNSAGLRGAPGAADGRRSLSMDRAPGGSPTLGCSRKRWSVSPATSTSRRPTPGWRSAAPPILERVTTPPSHLCIGTLVSGASTHEPMPQL